MLKIYWNFSDEIKSFEKKDIYLVDFIEKNKLKLRKKYLELIKGIGKYNYKDDNILNITKIDGLHNLFECGLIEEKSFYKSGKIISILKILAFLELIKKRNTSYLILNSNHQEKKILQQISNDKKIVIQFEDIKKNKLNKKNLRYFYNILPNILKVHIQIVKKIFIRMSTNRHIKKLSEYENIFYSNTYYLRYDFNKKTKLNNKFFGKICDNLKNSQILICHFDKFFKCLIFSNISNACFFTH